MYCEKMRVLFIIFSTKLNMLIIAENIAEKYAISREAQDEYASKSQQKAEAAIITGNFEKEIIPVTIASRKETIIVSKDEFPKFGTTTEKLAKLKPAFKSVWILSFAIR